MREHCLKTLFFMSLPFREMANPSHFFTTLKGVKLCLQLWIQILRLRRESAAMSAAEAKNGSVGKLKLSSEMKEKLEAVTGSRKNSIRSNASSSKRSELVTILSYLLTLLPIWTIQRQTLACIINQGILNGEVSLYRWPPVWLAWNQLYDYIIWYNHRLL